MADAISCRGLQNAARAGGLPWPPWAWQRPRLSVGDNALRSFITPAKRVFFSFQEMRSGGCVTHGNQAGEVCAHKQRGVFQALVPLLTHRHLDPADSAPAAARPWGGGRESCSCPPRKNCAVLKGDLNLCVKGSRVFVPDFILPAFAFYFGLAFSPSFWPVLCFPLDVSCCVSPAAGCPLPSGVSPAGCPSRARSRFRSWGWCSPLPSSRPGSRAFAFSRLFPIDVSHLQRVLCCCYFFFFIVFLAP